MLQNKYTLTLDSDGGTATRVFDRYSENPNRSDYIGDGHTPSTKDLLQFSRVLPRKAGGFYGAAKSSLKFTKEITAKNTSGMDVQVPRIMEVSASLPVGCTEAQFLESLSTVRAMINDTAAMKNFFFMQHI